MGCLPLPIAFILGVGIGYLAGGQNGALWGAGIGLLVGLVGMGLFIKAMRSNR